MTLKPFTLKEKLISAKVANPMPTTGQAARKKCRPMALELGTTARAGHDPHSHTMLALDRCFKMPWP